MRIVEVIPQLSSGGAERFVVDLCNELTGRGHEVTLVVLNNLDEYGFYRGQINERVRVIGLDKRPGFDWRLFGRLDKLIRGLNPDVVHTHLRSIVYTSLCNARTAKLYRWIHTIHNDAKVEASDLLSRNVRKWLFGRRKTVPVTISAESHDSYLKYYGDDFGQPVMIPNGSPFFEADASKATEVKEMRKDYRCVIVNVARMAPQKNHIEMVKAVEAMDGKVGLLVVGDNETEIGEEVRGMGLKHTRLLGTRKNPRDYMAAADGFALMSRYEGMPITLIECFAVGAVPLCTPVGGIVNMVTDGENGILADGVGREEIKGAFERFVNMTDEERVEMKRRSAESFAAYDISTCATRYLDLMQKKSL